jgi:glycosyltransferase involved in cell wall biosynthesis
VWTGYSALVMANERQRQHNRALPESQTRAQPVVSVIVPARNAAGTLGAQLSALTSQTPTVPTEIVVVDNASIDDTAGVANRYEGVRVIVVPTPGANLARNVGIAATSGDIVLLTDADDVVTESWIDRMYAASKSAHYFGGPVEFALLNDRLTRERWGVSSTPQFVGSTSPYPSPIGCNCGFHRSVWEAVGGFNEVLAVANDESEFFWRAGHRGFTFAPVPDATVHQRLRSDPWRIMQREFHAGIGDVVAYSVSRELGSERETWGRSLHVYAWIARLAMTGFWDRSLRWQALRLAARRLGRLRESVRLGVRYL